MAFNSMRRDGPGVNQVSGSEHRPGGPGAACAEADAVKGPEGRAGVPQRRHVGDSEATGAKNATAFFVYGRGAGYDGTSLRKQA
jgi:hypothetical protein